MPARRIFADRVLTSGERAARCRARRRALREAEPLLKPATLDDLRLFSEAELGIARVAPRYGNARAAPGRYRTGAVRS
jgi:hypothetical protein